MKYQFKKGGKQNEIVDRPVGGYDIPGSGRLGSNLYCEVALCALWVSGNGGSQRLFLLVNRFARNAGIPFGIRSFDNIPVLRRYTKPTKNDGKLCEKRRK